MAPLPARLVPGVRGNIEVATALSRSGSQVVAAGRQSVQVLDALGVGAGKVSTLFKGGTVNLGLLEQAAPENIQSPATQVFDFTLKLLLKECD